MKSVLALAPNNRIQAPKINTNRKVPVLIPMGASTALWPQAKRPSGRPSRGHGGAVSLENRIKTKRIVKMEKWSKAVEPKLSIVKCWIKTVSPKSVRKWTKLAKDTKSRKSVNQKCQGPTRAWKSSVSKAGT